MSNTVCENRVTFVIDTITETYKIMIKKIYFSKKTAFVYISSETEEKCDKLAKTYFKSKHIRKYNASGIKW